MRVHWLKMVKLIALYGPQQVGKSTAAQSLVEHHNYTRVAFADPLYQMISALLGRDARDVPKNLPMDELEGKTIREALQSLGTEWGRDLIGSELWVNTARRRITRLLGKGKKIVIDDCRFRNEYRALWHLSARFVRLSREDIPEQINIDHGSELEWQSFEPAVSIANPTDSAELWKSDSGQIILEALSGAED